MDIAEDIKQLRDEMKNCTDDINEVHKDLITSNEKVIFFSFSFASSQQLQIIKVDFFIKIYWAVTDN